MSLVRRHLRRRSVPPRFRPLCPLLPQRRQLMELRLCPLPGLFQVHLCTPSPTTGGLTVVAVRLLPTELLLPGLLALLPGLLMSQHQGSPQSPARQLCQQLRRPQPRPLCTPSPMTEGLAVVAVRFLATELLLLGLLVLLPRLLMAQRHWSPQSPARQLCPHLPCPQPQPRPRQARPMQASPSGCGGGTSKSLRRSWPSWLRVRRLSVWFVQLDHPWPGVAKLICFLRNITASCREGPRMWRS
mmetsp:Transcript_57362/g.125968  ORF Transcript_57362/g.125968 Transcript_57362/m.125968 type:complete len:243 (-) Transcript_57362:106-834(-)